MTGRRNFWFAANILICSLATSAIASVPAALADENATLTGNWARDDGAARIAISPCGAEYCAVNTWEKDPNGREKVGDKLVLTLTPASGSKLQGQAYDVRRDMHYKMTITLNGNEMQTSGCVFLGVICRNANWTRTN